MNDTTLRRRDGMDAPTLARGLGWFSIALGMAEFLRPRLLKRRTGAPGPTTLVQAFGLREIATGALILTSDRPVSMVWARVAGDILDLATLAPTIRRSNPNRAGGLVALLLVAGATAIDLYVATRGQEDD